MIGCAVNVIVLIVGLRVEIDCLYVRRQQKQKEKRKQKQNLNTSIVSTEILMVDLFDWKEVLTVKVGSDTS
jgi:hypothetical protein